MVDFRRQRTCKGATGDWKSPVWVHQESVIQATVILVFGAPQYFPVVFEWRLLSEKIKTSWKTNINFNPVQTASEEQELASV